MLKLTNICKQYKIKDLNIVNALLNVSINFRKNEFVAILGPSGGGKTTLLNIIGGLDKYTSGDLVIVGKSTKEFSDRDWDIYRNQRIGFIFQAYNLIPHQTILENVELALTISGVSPKQRKQMAMDALDKVGLEGKYNRKPNQLSGGQCQRVAIARALVNNPEILLADEPTGALDTKTSKQIMDLIKEVSKDRLVIMVTHNPELAEAYSDRIINLKDGEVEHDSNPYSDEEEAKEIAALDTNTVNKTSKAKMSFFAALKLSFTNLLSKFKRTFLVAIASSIGIIGVSAVLSVSFGVRGYIDSMQDDMLSSYPIQIAEESVDYTSLISGLSNWNGGEIADFDITSKIGMDSMIDYLMNKYTDVTSVKTNNITSTLVSYINQLEDTNAVSAFQYNYGIDVTNNIFCEWKKDKSSDSSFVSLNGLTQKYIAELKTVQGFSEYASYVDLFTDFMQEMPGDKDYILSQYDLLGNSQFAQDENDIMLVVDANQTLTDLRLAQMGYYTQEEFLNIARRVILQNEYKKQLNDGVISKEEYEEKCAELDEKYAYPREFKFEDLIGSELYYFPQKTLYSYSTVNITTERETSIVAIDPTSGITYLTYNFDRDMMTGLSFSFTSGSYDVITMRRTTPVPNATGLKMIEGTWEGNFYFESGSVNVLPDGEGGEIAMLSEAKAGKDAAHATALPSTTRATSKDVTTENTGYNYPAHAKEEWLANPELYGGTKMKVSGILKPKDTTKFGCLTRGIYYTKDLADKYIEDANDVNNPIITNSEHGFKAYIGSEEEKSAPFNAFVSFPYTDFSTDGDVGLERDDGFATALNGDLGNSFSQLFSSLTGGSNNLETDKVHFRSLTGLKIINPGEGETEYTFEQLPEEIYIYPTNFDSKDIVTKHLDKWNSDEVLIIDDIEVKKADREDITYSDTVSMIINVINLFITIVTTALIIFTSLSLVVSCFMIAVITIISVMERIKEIGVIRSLGGRKRDVSALFICENLMTGLFAGTLGIALTYVISIIINVSVKVFGVPAIASLPWWAALMMIGVSIFLSVVAGLVPSLGAAKKDPVNALRSE